MGSIMQATRIAVAVCAAALPLWGQPAGQDPLLRWMDQIAQQQLTQRESTIAGIRTTADADRRRQWVRAKFLEIIGGLPDYHGPLNARITGRIRNDSYTLEKVIFESLPHYFVTANLYRPNQPGRYPAVLMSAGHTTLGKTENHVMAANLAAKGFVALAYDPVGLGERMQDYDSRVGRGIAGCCTNEHLQAGTQSILIGESVARYFIWDAMRALDYLVSRPEVDPDRVGAAGCSGGGCLTTYIAALDPRIKAAAPACFLNSYRLLFAGPDPDSEMGLPEFLVSGLDHADFLEVVAPSMPWLVLTTEGDYFTPPGVRMVYDEARRWYQIYGAQDKLRYFLGPGPHGTPRETREQMYGWMIRWLKDGKGDAKELEIPLYPDYELQVTKSGQVDDEPGSRKLYQVILEQYRARKQPRGIPELLAELRRLHVPSDGQKPLMKSLEETSQSAWRRIRINIQAEPDLDIQGTLYVPTSSGRKPALLLVKDRTSAAVAQMAAAKGTVVLDLEPRDSPSGDDHRPYLGNWQTNSRANAIGRNLPAMRAHDILQGVDLLAGRDDVDPAKVRAAAWGVKGMWLLLAAAVDPRIGGIWLDHTPYSLSSALERPLNASLFETVIPGFLLHWDTQDLVRAIAPRPVLWTDPANWVGQTVPLGGGFRYRYDGQKDDAFLAELLR
jgi:cephalosporin-C deacetylase-like acetyl esterase